MTTDHQRSTAGRDAARVAALCLAVAALFYARQISMWAVPRNRFHFYWQRRDTWALLAGLLVLWLLLLLVVWLLRRVPRGQVLLRWLTIIVMADILVGYVGSGKAQGRFALFTSAWAVATGAALYAASRASPRTIERGTSVLAALAWLAPLFVVQTLLWKPWEIRPVLRVRPPAPAPANRTPVFLFLFDEWSFVRSHHGADLHPRFHNLRRLAAVSLEFTKAHTLAGATDPSIPRLLFQRDGVLEPGNGVAMWKEGDSKVVSSTLPSIFAAGQARGYYTALIGTYFPYRTLLGDQVDFVADAAYVPKRQSFWARVLSLAIGNLDYLADPLSQLIYQRDYARTLSENWYRLNHRWRRLVRDLIRQSDANTFAMVHWPLPHAPFVLNADGSYRGPINGPRMAGTPADYQKHLGFLDLVLGEAMTELDSAGLFDRALVIVTSDHSWKHEPDPGRRKIPGEQTWVPLFVKLPHQTVGHRVTGPFCMGQLGALLQRVMDGSLTTANALSEVTALPSSAPCVLRTRRKLVL